MALLDSDDRFYHRLVFLIAVVICLAIPVTTVRIIGALVLMCYIPAAPFATRSGLPFLPTLAFAVTASPIMFALPVLVIVALGLPTATAIWAIVAIAMAQYLIFGAGGSLPETDSQRRLALCLAGVLAVATILALWLPATDTWWRYREESWFNAAVLNRIANHGFPVIDPYFTPMRFQDLYFYHIILTCVSTLAGIGPFGAMIFVNFLALSGFVLGFNFLAGVFAPKTLPRTLGVVLGLFGMNGLFYCFFPIRLARAYFGETTGTDLLRQFFSLHPLNHDTASRFVSVEGNQFMFLDKFMIGTSLSLTLGLVCVLIGLVAWSRRGDWNRLQSFFYVAGIAGVMYLHLVIGFTVLVATFGVVLFRMLPRTRADGGTFPLGWHALLTLAAGVVAAPYVASVIPYHGDTRAVGFALQIRHVVGIVSCILPSLIPAAWYAARRGGERPLDAEGRLTASGTVLVWAGVATVLALVIDLPTNHESQFSFVLYIPLAAVAAGGLAGWADSGRRGVVTAVVYVVVCTVPLSAVYFTGAFRDQSRFAYAPRESFFYDWVRTATTADAVFLEDRDVVRIPVLSARDQYWGTEEFAKTWAYPPEELSRRHSLRESVFRGQGPTREELLPVAALDRPFYIVLRDIHGSNLETFKRFSANPLLTGGFLTGNIAVFHVELK